MSTSMPVPSAAMEARRVADAYASVFGHSEARSEEQRLVMADIESFCRAYRLCVESATDGSIATDNHVLNEGRRSVWLRIRGQIIESQRPAPQPPSISRKKPKTQS